MSNSASPVNSAQIAIRSILAVDFGSVHTRLLLVDLVEGQYRVVSTVETLTTSGAPIGNVTIGLTRALDQLAAQTGRVFERNGNFVIPEEAEGAGFDQLVVSVSNGRPMRAALVGLMPDLSLQSGRRALQGVYVEIVEAIHADDLRSTEAQVNALIDSRPDVIMIVGGTNGGAHASVLGLMQIVRAALALIPAGRRPLVIFGGNDSVALEANALLTGQIDAVQVTANVRPISGQETLSGSQLELVVAYGAYQIRQQPGLSDIGAHSPLGVLPTAIGYNVIVQYLSETAGHGNTLCVDVGAHNVVVSAFVDRQPILSIHSNLGLGQSAADSLKAVGVAQVRRWLPFDADDEQIADYAWNKVLRPGTVPQTVEELAIEQAFTRAIVQHALRLARQGLIRTRHGWPPFETVVGAGAVFTNGVPPELGALLLLESVQPTGVVRLLLDPGAVIPALGSLAYVQPLAVTQTIDNGGLLDLGTAICPDGQVLGSGAIRATVTFADGSSRQVAVTGGDLAIVPLPVGQEARVTIQLGRGLSLGRGRTFTVRGGTVGIIFDGRGRPLTLPNDAARRQKMLTRWQKRALDSFASLPLDAATIAERMK